MTSPFQSINQRIIDDLRKSRGDAPAEYVPKPASPKRDADDETADETYSSDGARDDDVPFEAPDADA
jgi:hypothetical protein